MIIGSRQINDYSEQGDLQQLFIYDYYQIIYMKTIRLCVNQGWACRLHILMEGRVTN